MKFYTYQKKWFQRTSNLQSVLQVFNTKCSINLFKGKSDS